MMRSILLIGTLTFISSYLMSQSHNPFQPFSPQIEELILASSENKIHAELDCINETICLYLDSDLNNWQITLVQVVKENEKTVYQPIDTVSMTAYSSTLNFYKSSEPKDGTVLLWETKYEFSSVIYAYWILNDSLITIGELRVRLDCSDCDDLIYPIEAIIISKQGVYLHFDFAKDLIVDESLSYKAGRFQYEFGNRELKSKVETN